MTNYINQTIYLCNMKVVMSLGNPIKSDDNIGNLVVDKLKKDLAGDYFVFIKAEISPENFFFKIAQLNPSIIYLIDTVPFSDKIGDVKVFDFHDIVKLPMTTTHNMSVTMLSMLAGGAVIKLIGIQPKKMDFGEELSPELKERFWEIYGKVEKIIK